MAAEELVLDSLMAEGDGGGDAGGDAGDLGGEENQQVDGQETGTDGVTKQGGKAGEQDDKQDGRKNPDAIRKHLAALKADPTTKEFGQELTNKLGKVRGYEEVFPTVKEARETRTLIESVGGREAVTAAIESHATMQRVDQQIAAGDPAVVEDMFKQSPEGMAKLAGPILDQLAKANPAAYKAALVPHAIAMMQADGFSPAFLNSLVDSFNKDDKAGLQEKIGSLIEYYKGLMQGAKPKGIDPDRVKLDDDKKAWETQKQQEAIKSTFNTNLDYSASKIDAGIAADVKRLNLSEKQVEKLRQNVWKELETRRNKDSVFTTTLNSKFDGKTPKADAVTWLNGFTDRNVADAINEVVTSYYGDRKAVPARVDPTAPKKAAGAGKGAAAAPAAGAIKVPKALTFAEIDYNDPRTTTKGVLGGVAVRKSDKKLVQWS